MVLRESLKYRLLALLTCLGITPHHVSIITAHMVTTPTGTNKMKLASAAMNTTGVSGCGLQAEVWSMAVEAQSSELDCTAPAEAGQLAPWLSDVQLVEAFFDVEQRLLQAAAAAAHPTPLSQVRDPPTLNADMTYAG